MLNFLLTFKAKIFIYLALFLLLVGSIYFIYNKGYNAGSNEQKLAIEKQYNEILENRMKENTDRLTREFQAKLDSQKEKVRVQKIYIDREVKIDNFVSNSPVLSNKEIKMSDEELKELNEYVKKP